MIFYAFSVTKTTTVPMSERHKGDLVIFVRIVLQKSTTTTRIPTGRSTMSLNNSVTFSNSYKLDVSGFFCMINRNKKKMRD